MSKLKKPNDKKSSADKLRAKAEEKLFKSKEKLPHTKGKNLDEIIYELHVHQIELEMQNDELHKSQVALEESREKYFDLYNFAPIGYFTLTQKDLVIEANLIIAEQLGIGRKDLINSRFRKFIYPEDTEKWDKYFTSLLKYEEKKSCELRIARQNGSMFYASLESIRIDLSDGTSIIRIALIDITRRKEAEIKTQFLAHTIKSVEEIITITDMEDRFTFVNQTFCNLYGYTYDEIIGKHIKIIQSPNNPTDLLKNILLHSRKEGWKGEILNLTKDGREFPIYLQTSQIKNEKGEILGLVGVSEDITKRKQTESNLRKSEEKYHSIFESTGTATLIVEEDTTISMANKECTRITGYTQKELVGTKWINYVEPTSLPEMLKNHNLRRQNPESAPKNYEVKLINKNKDIRNTILDIGMIPGTKQSIVSILDITERKQMEEAIQKSEAQFKALFISLREGFYISEIIYDDNNNPCDYRYIDINPKFEQIIGLSRDQIIGKRYKELVPYDTTQWLNNYFMVARTGEPRLYEFYSKEFDMHFETYSYQPIKNQISVIVRDITERKHVEEKLRKSEMQLSNALDIAHLGPWEYDVLKDEFTFNDHFYKIFRTTAEQVGGYKMSSLEYARRFVHPDDLHMVADETRLAIETTNPNFNRQLEHRIIYTDGTIGYITVLFFIIKDDKGNTIKTYGVNQDITERKMAEVAIKISEEKFRKVFSTSPDSININRLDDGMYIAINSGFTQSTGYTDEDVKGKTSIDINIWDNPDDRKKLIEGLKSDGLVKNLEARFRKKNGEVNYGLMSASVIDLNGMPHIISITRDITDRKKAEEVIRDSERKFRETVENLQEGYYKCTVDGILLEHNPAFCEILGFNSDKDLSGVRLPDFWQNPADREVYLKDMAKAGYIKNYTINAKKTNDEKMYILVNSHFLKDDNEKYTGIEGTIVDLTERKQAEEALKESEIKYRNLIETMPEGFYRSKPEGFFIDVNPAIVKMLGYDNKEELMKVNIPEELYFSRDERIDGVNYNIDFVPDTDVYRLKKKDGSEIWVEDHSRYIQDDSGNVLFHEGIMRDITESLRAQKAIVEAKEKAEEVSRLKTSFLASMSHEIRTPLNGILGFADILKNELKEPAHKNFADIIEKSGNRLLETLDLILSFSKLEAEKEDVHYSNVRIENVIGEVLKSFEVVAKNKNLFLDLSIKEEKLVTKIDERFLRQILNNLINNAIKYTDAGGITVTLLRDNNNVLINVKDTGIGIAKDKHRIIFEEFRQESEGHGRSFEGTGLGLAITKRFVELMKGTIEVESEVGVGSIFTVKFPYEKALETITIKMQKDEPRKEIIIPAPPDKDKLSVLLVENDLMNLDYTITVLNAYYNIESAVDGPEAIEKVKTKVFDIILMDINLGKGMDGIKVVSEIRKQHGYEKTPIVALTAFVLPGDREEFLKGGCTHYLGKPFTRNQILELLNKIKV